MEDATAPVHPQYFLDCRVIVQRFWAKLREFGFQTPGYNHIYLTFSPTLRPGELEFRTDRGLWWLTNVKVGALLDEVNQLPEMERHDLLVKFVATSLKALCVRDHLDVSKVQIAENLLLERKSELESLHLVKETVSYRVAVSFQVCPQNGPSLAFVEYTDKKGNKTGKTPLTQLRIYDDLYWIASTVCVRKGIILIRPRTGFKARFYCKEYSVPFRIRVSDLLDGTPSRNSQRKATASTSPRGSRQTRRR
jgi:hypothetical protein